MPLGVGYISSVLKQIGHEVKILDVNATRWPQDIVEEWLFIHNKNYDLFGISGIITTFKYQKWLIETIRKFTQKPIICGGGCASVVGKMLLKAGSTEVITGAGENALLSYLKSSLTYKTIDDIPSPDWKGLPMETYIENPIWGGDTGNGSNVGIHLDMQNIRRSVNVITSRGCPFNCNFCYDLFGRGYQQRSVENVINELKGLKKNYNIDFVGFVDDNMFVNKKWVLAFCEKMKGLKLFWGCHARVNEVSEEILTAAYNAGCRWIGYGIESGSQTILNLMNKRTTVEQAKKAIRLTKKYNIYPNTSFIYGYPGETKKTVDETIEFCKNVEIKPKFFYATPYPGSKLYKDYELKILKKFGNFEMFIEKLGDAQDFVINLSGLSDDRFFKLKNYLEARID